MDSSLFSYYSQSINSNIVIYVVKNVVSIDPTNKSTGITNFTTVWNDKLLMMNKKVVSMVDPYENK